MDGGDFAQCAASHLLDLKGLAQFHVKKLNAFIAGPWNVIGFYGCFFKKRPIFLMVFLEKCFMSHRSDVLKQDSERASEIIISPLI
jgi:hypothetical protein